MNYKNILQEYCQKNRLAFPRYTTFCTDTYPTRWYGTIELNSVVLPTNTDFTNKTDAEQNLAAAMLAHIQPYLQLHQQATQPQTPRLPLTPRLSTLSPLDQTYNVLIDLENLQPRISHISPNVTVTCFLSTFSTINTTPYKHCTIVLIDSGLPEAVDHALTFYAASIPLEHTVVIVSRDRSSEVLAYLLKSRGQKVLHYKNTADFDTFIRDL